MAVPWSDADEPASEQAAPAYYTRREESAPWCAWVVVVSLAVVLVALVVAGAWGK